MERKGGKGIAAGQIASGVGLAAKQAPSMMKEFCLLFFQKVRIKATNYSSTTIVLVTRNPRKSTNSLSKSKTNIYSPKN
jgi:hypothetical protein